MSHTTIVYVESSLPATPWAECLAELKHYSIALGIADWGNTATEVYQQTRIPIAAVQAYQMHHFNPRHRDLNYLQQAQLHLADSLELTARLQYPRIVTVCGFGHDRVDSPYE